MYLYSISNFGVFTLIFQYIWCASKLGLNFQFVTTHTFKSLDSEWENRMLLKTAIEEQRDDSELLLSAGKLQMEMGCTALDYIQNRSHTPLSMLFSVLTKKSQCPWIFKYINKMYL